MLAITTTFEYIGHWIRMRQSLAWYSAPVSSVHTPSWADFITTMVGFRVFGTHRSRTIPGGAANETGTRKNLISVPCQRDPRFSHQNFWVPSPLTWVPSACTRVCVGSHLLGAGAW